MINYFTIIKALVYVIIFCSGCNPSVVNLFKSLYKFEMYNYKIRFVCDRLCLSLCIKSADHSRVCLRFSQCVFRSNRNSYLFNALRESS